MGPSQTDCHTGTTNNYHSTTIVHQQEPTPLSPHSHLVASRTTFFPCCLTLSFQAYINTTHKDGSKNSAMVAWLKQPHYKTSFGKLLLETCTTKTSEAPSVGSPKSYKQASKTKTSLFPPTIIHSNWSTCLRSQFCHNTSSLHTTPNPALTQPTSPPNRDPSFDESNFLCPMGASPNLKHTYMLFLRHISWPSILCYTYSPFTLQTLDIVNQVIWAKNRGYTKPRACTLVQEHWMYQTTCSHSTSQLLHHSTKGYHDTLYDSTMILFKYSYSHTIQKRCSPGYGRLSFSLHLMSNTLFSTFFPPLQPPLSITQPFQSHVLHQIFWQIFSEKDHFGPFSQIWTKMNFSRKKGLSQFLNISVIYHYAKNQEKLMSH